MWFNIVSNLKGNPNPADFNAYNHIIAYHLHNALTEKGHSVEYVSDQETQLPYSDHTIVISNLAISHLRNNAEYYQTLRRSTGGKLCLWLDSDFGDWDKIFDRVLVVNRSSLRNPEVFKYVGYAATPETYYPQQSEPSVFVDPYMTGFYKGQYDNVYRDIAEVLREIKTRIIQPITHYNHGRVPWYDFAELLRQTTHYIVTQPGYWGLTNIEAATCGALLLIHESLDKPDTWPTRLNHKIYSSKQELAELLNEPINIEANRHVALENSWGKVTSRVLEALN